MQDNTLLNVAGLGFFDIRYNFINYLKSQPQFTDYNLEGSNFSVLLDILAYNTQQQAFYNTLVANEMFIDKATKRSSVVGIAKSLGYSPSTRKAATAKVFLVVSPDDLPIGGVVERGSIFSGTNTNVNYPFVTAEAYSFFPYEVETSTNPDENSGNIISYAAGPITLKQGALNTVSYNVDSYQQEFYILEKNIDRSAIRVFVLNSLTDTTGYNDEWTFVKNITTINQDSKIYFLNENEVGQIYLTFGDGVLGKKLEVGNVVIIEYLTTSGEEANGIGLSDSLNKNSFTSELGKVITLEASSGGAERESSRSIKKNAIVNYTSKERAVTIKDYEGIVLGAFNDNASVRCWGGEDNDPPQYGRVYLSIRPLGSTVLTEQDKRNLINNVLKDRNIVGTTVEIVDPEVLYVNSNINVYYDRNFSNLNTATLMKQIKTALFSYFRNSLVEFGDSIFALDVENTIKDLNEGIKAVDVNFVIERRIVPTLGVSEITKIDFQNKLYHPQDGYKTILTTNTFKILSNGSLLIYFMRDDGNGNIVLYNRTNGVETIIDSKYGTIDYINGKIVLPKFKVDAFELGKNFVEFKVIPDQPNIFTKRNSILAFEQNDNDSLNVEIKEVKTQKVIGGSGSVISRA